MIPYLEVLGVQPHATLKERACRREKGSVDQATVVAGMSSVRIVAGAADPT